MNVIDKTHDSVRADARLSSMRRRGSHGVEMLLPFMAAVAGRTTQKDYPRNYPGKNSGVAAGQGSACLLFGGLKVTGFLRSQE